MTGLVGDAGWATALGWLLAVIGGVVISWLATIALFAWFGSSDAAWRSRMIGAGVTAVGVVVLSLGYLVYISHGANWEERVAGSGVAAAVLFARWLHLANVLLLVGYSVQSALDRTRRATTR